MATARLVPSILYNAAGTTYLTVSDENNAFTNTDSTTYATISNIYTSTTSRYIYLQGFNFDDIPANAVVSSFEIKLKVNESGGSTSSNYRPVICKGTSTYSNAYCDAITTSVSTHTFSFTQDFDTFRDDGDDFGIRINCRRNSRTTAASFHIYGAEIQVEYTVPNPRTVTSNLTGDGTIDPNGVYNTSEGEEYTLTITPTDKSNTVTVTQDGTDITSQLIAHYGTGNTLNTDLGTYNLVSGGFNGSGATYFSGIVGNGSDASTTSSNYYSSGSSTIAVFTYNMGINVPSNAVIERVWCDVSGHAESTSNSSEYMCAMLISGETELSEELNFKQVGTSNSVQTLECTTLPTVAQLANMKLQCRLGYYGGAINGATAYVTYSMPGSQPEYYTYTYIVSNNSIINVIIGAQQTNKLFIKQNGNWKQVKKVFLKQNGNWIEVIDVSNIFSTLGKYVHK